MAHCTAAAAAPLLALLSPPPLPPLWAALRTAPPVAAGPSLCQAQGGMQLLPNFSLPPRKVPLLPLRSPVTRLLPILQPLVPTGPATWAGGGWRRSCRQYWMYSNNKQYNRQGEGRRRGSGSTRRGE